MAHNPRVDRASDLRVVVLSSYPMEAACTRFRVGQYSEALARCGVHLTFLPFLSGRAFRHLYDPRQFLRTAWAVMSGVLRRLLQLPFLIRADLIFVQREAMLIGPPIVEWVVCRLAHCPMVLDLDDATYIEQASIYGRLARALKWRGKPDQLIDWSSFVICGNARIEEYVRNRGKNAVVLPTIVDTALFVPPPEPVHREVPVIGWIGSHSTYGYLATVIPVLEDLRREFNFRVRIIGAGRRSIAIRGVEVDVQPWRLETEVPDFQSLDIGLYPLPGGDDWAASKSGLKAVEYLSIGIPFVASAVGAVAAIGVAGRTHFVATTDAEWREALARLLRDPEERREMGRQARLYAVANYSIDEFADRIAAWIRDCAEHAGEVNAIPT